MRICMHFMRLHGSEPARELGLSLAGAYLTFYIANAPREALHSCSRLSDAYHVHVYMRQDLPSSGHRVQSKAGFTWDDHLQQAMND